MIFFFNKWLKFHFYIGDIYEQPKDFGLDESVLVLALLMMELGFLRACFINVSQEIVYFCREDISQVLYWGFLIL